MPWKFVVVVFGCVGYFQLVSEVVTWVLYVSRVRKLPGRLKSRFSWRLQLRKQEHVNRDETRGSDKYEIHHVCDQETEQNQVI